MARNDFIKLERTFVITKALTDDGEFEGYASTFDNEDSYGDTVRAGAFKAGLQKLVKNKQKLKMLWNHDRYQPIGTFKEADEDTKGLYVRGKFTKGVQKADETHLLMQDGAVDSMSIGGYVIKELFDNKTLKRDLLEIELREISPVTFPANEKARVVAVKSLDEVDTLTQLEAYLRDVGGFSVKEAKSIISKAKSGNPPRDVGDALAQLRDTIRS